MKKLIEKIMFPYNKIESLEKEIRYQDNQYITQQIQFTKLNREKKLLEEENKRLEEENKKLEEANTKHLATLRERRKEIKALQNEIKEIRANS